MSLRNTHFQHVLESKASAPVCARARHLHCHFRCLIALAGASLGPTTKGFWLADYLCSKQAKWGLRSGHEQIYLRSRETARATASFTCFLSRYQLTSTFKTSKKKIIAKLPVRHQRVSEITCNTHRQRYIIYRFTCDAKGYKC